MVNGFRKRTLKEHPALYRKRYEIVPCVLCGSFFDRKGRKGSARDAKEKGYMALCVEKEHKTV